MNEFVIQEHLHIAYNVQEQNRKFCPYTGKYDLTKTGILAYFTERKPPIEISIKTTDDITAICPMTSEKYYMSKLLEHPFNNFGQDITTAD